MDEPVATPNNAERLHFGLIALGLAMVGVSIAVIYPAAIDRIIDRFGTRPTAAGLIALFGAAAIFSRAAAASARIGVRRGYAASFGLVVTLFATLAFDDRRILRLLPAWVYLGLALFCFANAREEESLLERGVRFAIPEAPPFIRNYCRGLTALWGGFFLATATTVAALAFAAPPGRWRAFTARDVWVAMAVVSVVEFFVRKTWFRYYYWNGPFERFWSRLFPAERTARGRRSSAYIDACRERIARERAGDAPGTAD